MAEDTESFQQIVVDFGDKPVFVKFSAGFCGPCQIVNDDLEKLSIEFEDRMGFVFVDVEKLDEIA